MKALPLLVLGVAGGAALYAVTRRPAPQTTGDTTGQLRLRVIQVGGSAAPRAFAALAQANPQFVEGNTYQVQVTVTNKSTRAGVAVSAALTVVLAAQGLLAPLAFAKTVALDAGGSATLTSPMVTIPTPLAASLTGQPIAGALLAGDGTQLATASLAVDIVQAAVNYGGSVSIGTGAGTGTSADATSPTVLTTTLGDPLYSVGQTLQTLNGQASGTVVVRQTDGIQWKYTISVPGLGWLTYAESNLKPV